MKDNLHHLADEVEWNFTQTQVGEAIGVGKARLQQIEVLAIRQLRWAPHERQGKRSLTTTWYRKKR